nr:hypothetical protein [Tanacetum cinerariifolium]
MLGLLDVHWSLKFARLIHGFLLTIKSCCVALKLFTVMQYWDKCIINFKKINETLGVAQWSHFILRHCGLRNGLVSFTDIGGRLELGKVGKGRGNNVEWWGSAGIGGRGLVRCGGKTGCSGF